MLCIAQPLTELWTMSQGMTNVMPSGSETPYRSVIKEGASLTQHPSLFGATERAYFYCSTTYTFM
jgi:hypothetical protein